MLYASSAATYGGSATFREDARVSELPLNVYGYSKLLFDQRMRRECGSLRAPGAPGGGLSRHFNVYGPREQHKGRMASVAFHQFNQFRETGKVKLFGEYGGYAPGQQMRDFVFVDDVVAVNLWFLHNPGQSRHLQPRQRPRAALQRRVASVNAARAPEGGRRCRWPRSCRADLEYIPSPTRWSGAQSFTQADLTRCAPPAATTSRRRGRPAWRATNWLAAQG